MNFEYQEKGMLAFVGWRVGTAHQKKRNTAQYGFGLGGTGECLELLGSLNMSNKWMLWQKLQYSDGTFGEIK